MVVSQCVGGGKFLCVCAGWLGGESEVGGNKGWGQEMFAGSLVCLQEGGHMTKGKVRGGDQKSGLKAVRQRCQNGVASAANQAISVSVILKKRLLVHNPFK